MSQVKVKLLNKAKVKEFALEMAKTRAHKFTRVGGDFLLLCEETSKTSFSRLYPAGSRPKVRPSTNPVSIWRQFPNTTPVMPPGVTGACFI